MASDDGICANAATCMRGWLGGPTQALAGWGVMSAVYYASKGGAGTVQTVYPGACPVASWATAEDCAKMVEYVRRPASVSGNPGPYGPAGVSTLLWWNGVGRVIGDITGTAGVRFAVNSVSMPGWDGTAVTV